MLTHHIQLNLRFHINKIKIDCIKMAKRKMESNNDSEKRTKQSKHWSLGLLDTMNDPEQQIKVDDKIIVIEDKYPKAKFHYLILPKENIADLKHLKKEHVELLKHMEDVGHVLIKGEEHDDFTFKFGYHSRASMQRLHLHVISNDMDSPCLKTKKHWVSFTSDFFIKAEDVRKSLEENGFVKLPSDEKIKEYFKSDLKCHKCKKVMKNMPTLKKHIVSCLV